MINIPFIPESAPFSTEQRAWLNGFLAGLFANGAVQQTPSTAASTTSIEPLFVLFGSQTGTAEGLARRLAGQARQRGFEPLVQALNDFPQAKLAAGGKAIIISSTWGEGDPPDNATAFWAWLNSDAAPRLQNLHFAVLGLGDRNYQDFCGASRKFDARLAELGAARLIPRGECDVDYETAAKEWIETLWPALSKEISPQNHTIMNGAEATIQSGQPVSQDRKASVAPAGATPYGKHNPFPARLLANVLLNRPNSAKEVRHYEFDLRGSGLSYQAGDALGIAPSNCPELVDDIIAALQSDAYEKVTVGGSEMSLSEALTRHLDITKPSQELIAAIATGAPNTELGRLFSGQRDGELKAWLYGRGVVDLLQSMPEPLPISDFLRLLRKLAPRLYSISSSPKAHPQEVHLTVSSVRYQSYGMVRKGVASTFLADRVGEEDGVKLFVQPSSFKPPISGDTRMIMVGPGTGIAPFRAFLQERQAIGAKGKNWLFFGDQTRAGDFLYESQLTTWHQEGLLSHLDLAFSRDQAEKLYVQHRMAERAAELWAWLDAGAHFYVCGDGSRMAKDVDECLHNIIERHGDKTPEEAKAFVNVMKTQKRYQRDVY